MRLNAYAKYVAVILVTMIATATVVITLTSAPAESTKTIMVTTTLTTTKTSNDYADLGSLLQLRIVLNASSIRSGQAINVIAVLLNPFSANISALPPNPPSSAIVGWNDYDFVCSHNSAWSLLGYAVFEGHYASSNISSAAAPLRLAPLVGVPCIQGPSPNLLVFGPNGSKALVFYLSQEGEGQPTSEQIGLTVATELCVQTLCPFGNSLLGYWNMSSLQGPTSPDNATLTSKYFHYFSPGEYTLVVEAAWGQQVIESFDVTS
jgi:hypothetical protein